VGSKDFRYSYAMLVLFTDFGAADVYVPQLKASLLAHAGRTATMLDLLHEAPAFDIPAAAHLLAALQAEFPVESVFLAVVDPGVGSARDAVVVRAHDKWFVGPDNGLLSVAAACAASSQCWRIVWRPDRLSDSFHGRDLFAPIAASLGDSRFPADKLQATDRLAVQLGPKDLSQVIYVDHYGNAMSGLRAGILRREERIEVAGLALSHAPVFSAAGPGEPFWYENSIGLVEIAVNRGSAAAQLGLRVGDAIIRRR